MSSSREVTVRLGDGVRIETATLGTVQCDARNPRGDYNVLTHAHGDHLPRTFGDAPIAASRLTAELAAVRRDEPPFTPAVPPEIDLLPAGHIEGSRAALIHDGETRILYTGDLCTRDRLGLAGFDPVPADVLVIEATYGAPQYRLPSQDELESRIADWLTETADRLRILFGYALGRAQRLLSLLHQAGIEDVYTTESIRALNAIIEDATDQQFRTRTIDRSQSLRDGDVVVVPSHVRRYDWFEDLVTERDPVTAGFTGWAMDSSYIYRRRVDRGFPLSDHCDFPELLEVVRAVDPEIVYTHHGFARQLAQALTKRGYDARSLQKHQTTLDSF